MKLSLSVLDQSNKTDTNFKSLLHQLDAYDAYLRALSDGSSNEGIGTGLLKVFVGITDVLLRVGNTFKTNMFKFYKGIKRSEMRFYSESHALKCKVTEGQSFDKLMNLSVDYPSGMQTTFLIAVESVSGDYASMNLAINMQSISNIFKELRVLVQRSASDQCVQCIAPIVTSSTTQSANLSKRVAAASKLFTETNTNKANFDMLYKSMAEFKQVRLSLLALESRLNDTGSLLNMIDELDPLIADITEWLHDDTNLNKRFVEGMSTIVRYLANALDYYGTIATRQMALEHNHILNINTCYDSIGQSSN